jgi:hypothetical protein
VRYCIVSSPRTGTTALTEALRIYSFQNNPISVYYGELHHINLNTLHVSGHKSITTINDYNSQESKEIRNLIKYYIEQTNSAMVGKYFPHIWHFEYFDPMEIPKYLLEHNFKLIHIRRNLFDVIISGLVANITGYYHTNMNPSYKDQIKPNFKDKLKLTFEFCIKTANHMSLSYYLVTQICKKYPITVINYDNLIEESTNLLPCSWDQVTLEKTYKEPYEEIIENYNEVKSWIKDFIHE